MMCLSPSPAVSVIPVLVSLFTPILNVVISPNTEYLLFHIIVDVPVTVNVAPLDRVLIPSRSHTVFSTLDEIYFVSSNIPPVLSVVHEK